MSHRDESSIDPRMIFVSAYRFSLRSTLTLLECSRGLPSLRILRVSYQYENQYLGFFLVSLVSFLRRDV